jgi:hypothetical protein
LPLVGLLFVIGATPTSAPSPEPTELREIGRVKASARCLTLRQLVLPVTLVAENNEREFVSLERPAAKFRSGKGGDDGAVALHNALTEGDASLKTLLMSDSSVYESRDPTAARNDDQNTYTPERTMAASNIERITNQIQHNLVAADAAMHESWMGNPGTGDAGVDVLRQRVQNVIDLQRVLAHRLDDVAGTYFSNHGVAGLTPGSQRGAYNALLDQILDAQVAEDAAAGSTLSGAASPAPPGDVGGAKRGTAGEVAMALRGQEIALAAEGAAAERACNGALSSPQSPSPATTP